MLPTKMHVYRDKKCVCHFYTQEVISYIKPSVTW
uniref:Uncharacterized protein n=1 Tax=Siphoviridae sp. ctqBH20 TaxID=2825680 RepID=A0A8S5QCD1_9CAUD|nr:MAG TPA: hypothetical protein [Siphoviridae sp. ctqBH20]